MAKQIIKKSAKALKTSTAKVTNGSNNIDGAHAEYLAKLKQLGLDARAGLETSKQAQLNAALAYAKAVEDKLVKSETDADGLASAKEAVAAYNPELKGTSFSSLVSIFRSFADRNVVKSADYSLVEGLRGKLGYFDAAKKVNFAIKRHMKEGGDKAKLPTVNAAFVKEAVAYTAPKKVPTNAAERKALAEKNAKKAFEAFKEALAALQTKAIRNALGDLTKAQVKALDTALSNFI